MHARAVVVLIFMVTVSIATGVFQAVFKKNPTVDKVCSTLPLKDFGVVRNAGTCGIKCGEWSDCSSFYFNTNGSTCLGSSRLYTNLTGCQAVPGTRYYYKAPSNLDVGCVSNSDCTGYNVECRHGNCSCIPGYSLQPELNTCEPGSTEFTANVSTCLTNCLAVPTCLTMRYKRTVGACRIDSRTPLTNPNNLIFDATFDLYMRDCAPN